MNNKFVLGDIHGRHEELVEVLKLANFDYENDQLISLGDLVDRGPEPYKCIFELMKIKNLISIVGNHDLYLYRWILNNNKYHDLGTSHGVGETLRKWLDLSSEEIEKVKFFLKSQIPYYLDKENRLFVHGGIYRFEKLEEQNFLDFCENRNFWEEVMSMQKKDIKKVQTVEDFSEIYIGHTPTLCYKFEKGLFRKRESWHNIVVKP
ncbi:MAG: metallophosphoesterase, partial [Bacteroidia bacterium]